MFETQYQQFIFLSKYARWLPKEKRRETWEETVSRYMTFFQQHLQERCGYNLISKEYGMLYHAIYELEVMPSMRCLMTAGPALRKDEISGYNCAFTALKKPSKFDEIMYILMCGTGVGFSVEHRYIDQLPTISDSFYDTDTTIVVKDSRIGWAKALRELISLLYSGQIPKWDVSEVRPKGARLKTFGGRSSGPEPLENVFKFAVATFRKAQGRKLYTIECHDLVCKIAECIVAGGVRRSALISLSDLEDFKMQEAKFGAWWETNGHRRLSNNSAVYEGRPDIGTFMKEWNLLYNSKSGERGIFNRMASQNQAKKNGRRDWEGNEYGTNPCSEIILLSDETCNLTDNIIRHDDTWKILEEKTRIAAILGTIQSTLTNYRYISKDWKKNNEEERLLGVSLTGIMDNVITNGIQNLGVLPDRLESMKEVTIKTNKEWAKKLGINPSVAITCVKPSGTVSQLVNSGSGIHPRHNEHYIRRVRGDKSDPLTQFMVKAGFPYEQDVESVHDLVFSFPIKAHKGAMTRKDLNAIDHLKLWKIYQDHWCEHKPSVTVSIKDHEWMKVGSWVYDNFDEISGVAFLPHTEHIYKQAPYEDIDAKKYVELANAMPKKINWAGLNEFEKEDTTTSEGELSCSAGGCEL